MIRDACLGNGVNFAINDSFRDRLSLTEIKRKKKSSLRRITIEYRQLTGPVGSLRIFKIHFHQPKLSRLSFIYNESYRVAGTYCSILSQVKDCGHP